MAIAEEWLRLAPKPRELAGSDQWNVFLSYRSVNRAWVLNLYDVLRSLGHKVFLDQCALSAGDPLIRKLSAGDPLIRKLQQGLNASQAGVLVWSTATQDSEWVEREYEVLERLATEKRGFHFVPVRLDSTPLPPFAANRIFLDFSEYPDGPNGGELLRLVHAVVGKPLSEEAVRFALEQDEAVHKAVNQISAAIEVGKPERLKRLFEDGGLPWRVSAALGCKAAEGLTRLGCNDDAIAMLEAVEARFARAIRPKQLHALALARRAQKSEDEAHLDVAQEILAEVYAAGERDPETLGIYGRTWMDRHHRTGDRMALRKSRDLYAQAFEAAQDDYYTGVNAASKSVFLGSPEDLHKARAYAERVQEIVGSHAWPGDYWKAATVAELLLIQKKYAQAGQLYQAAIDMAPEEAGSHESSWSQAKRLMEKLDPTPEERAFIEAPFVRLADVG